MRKYISVKEWERFFGAITAGTNGLRDKSIFQ